MSPNPFEATRLKIARAEMHVAELEREIEAYLSRNPIHMNVTPNANSDYLNWEQFCTESIPTTLAPIIGDIVHNLRSSLDLMACDLVRLNKGNDNKVYFPFADSPDQIEKMIKDKHFDRAAPEVVDLLRSLKPFKGGNDSLRYIHDLNIDDKHKMLIPVAGHIKNPGGAVGKDQEHLKPGKMSSGTILARVVPELSPGENLPVTFRLLFPWHGPFQDRELIETFYSLAEDFSGIVNSFETLCLGTVTQ